MHFASYSCKYYQNVPICLGVVSSLEPVTSLSWLELVTSLVHIIVKRDGRAWIFQPSLQS